MRSKQFIVLAILILTFLSFIFNPKWNKSGVHATLSWDVSGYYFYLPAAFIYKDLKELKFKDQLMKKYSPTTSFEQAYLHEESGHYIMKHSLGQAVQFAPFFFVAHMIASQSNQFEADGFSPIYQLMIALGSLFIALLGLILLRRILLEYFDDKTVLLTIAGIFFGSNYLNYASIDGAMTHNNLFTIYAGIIYCTQLLYKKPSWQKSITLGLLIGLAALTRPTEIIACLIPLLWGINPFHKEQLKNRLQFFKAHQSNILMAILSCVTLGSLQLIYWKYVSGDWLVYSYQEYGFNWLQPYIWKGLFHFRSGWLIYSPFMIFSLVGFYHLYKNHRSIFFASLTFTMLFIYISFAWEVWWYGGSLGQRTMVQAYPILAFPLAAFVQALRQARKPLRLILLPFILMCFYFNLWFTYQARQGGLLHVGQMTNRYYWRTLGRFEYKQENLKLLDDGEVITFEPKQVEDIYIDPDFNFQLNEKVQSPPTTHVDIPGDTKWLRVSADFEIQNKEWEIWNMTMFIVTLQDEERREVKQNKIRIQRHLDPFSKTRIYQDISIPKKDFDRIAIDFWHAHAKTPLDISNIKVESFSKK